MVPGKGKYAWQEGPRLRGFSLQPCQDHNAIRNSQNPNLELSRHYSVLSVISGNKLIYKWFGKCYTSLLQSPKSSSLGKVKLIALLSANLGVWMWFVD